MNSTIVQVEIGDGVSRERGAEILLVKHPAERDFAHDWDSAKSQVVALEPHYQTHDIYDLLRTMGWEISIPPIVIVED